MVAKGVRHFLLPLMLAAGVGACESNAVRPGIINTSAATSTSAPSTATSYGAPVGGSGRVVSIREVGLQGAGGGGNGTMMGGVIGAAGGATIGAVTSHSVAGGLVGALLGAVAGGIAGTIFDGQRGGGRGIEVTVQRDDGEKVIVAQRDDGDIQLGDRVQIIQDRQGVAKVVHDNSRNPD